MSLNELHYSTALELAELLRGGHVSSEELVRSYLQRIARLNPRVHAFVSVFRALRVAREKDDERRRSRSALPVFHGVPIGIKDLNVVRWRVTRWGSRAVPHFALPVDDRTVAPLRHAGFVIIGKLATAELGAMPVTEPDIHPPTRNPWSPAYSAGGSSGGSAAAVAAGMLPLAQGSDGAGSIRIPAAFCHVFGMKPSRGRVPNQFGLSDPRVLYESGPITHSVADAAAALDVMAERSRGRSGELLEGLTRARPRRMKINFVRRSFLSPTDPDVADAFRRSLEVLAGLGHDVEESTLPDATLEDFLPLWQYQIGRIPLVRWSRAQPVTRWLGQAGRHLHTRDVAALHDALAARFTGVLATADVWATPTVPSPPPLVGAFDGLAPSHAIAAAAQLGAFTALANVMGYPAASVPMGLTRQGLPMGLQLLGGPHGDPDVLAVARQLELATPWRQQHPPGLD